MHMWVTEMSQNVTRFVAGIIRNGWILWNGNETEAGWNSFLFVVKPGNQVI